MHQLSAICITHVHGDHCYGLPGLLASAAMSGRREPLTLIAPKSIAALLDAIVLTTELYLSFAIDFIAIEEVLETKAGKVDISLNDQHQLTVDITPLSHRVSSYGFGITQSIHRLSLNTNKLTADGVPASALWGKLQQGFDVVTGDGQQLRSADYVDKEVRRTRVVVAGDNDRPDCLSAAVRDADLLIHEATYTTDVLTRIQAKNPDFDPMHSSAQMVGKFAQNAGLKHLILTHFSARYQSFDNQNSNTPNMGHIRADAESSYQGSLWLTADFDQYMINGANDLLDSKETDRVQYLGSACSN
jgi:ribonuclease Z